jgi:hypothetical protein
MEKMQAENSSEMPAPAGKDSLAFVLPKQRNYDPNFPQIILSASSTIPCSTIPTRFLAEEAACISIRA